MPTRRSPSGRNRWSAKRLRDAIQAFYSGETVIVLANREPLRHERTSSGRIVTSRSASGLVTALEPLVHASSGVWIAHGSGTGDRDVVDARDGVDVVDAGGRYRLRRVWLDAEEERGYYYGFANEALWPLCHRAHVKPIFRSSDFRTYSLVNERFADAVRGEAVGRSPLVLVQDYHFALAPRMLRGRLPLGTIATFWHIPWPHPRDLEICPWAADLLQGMLGSHIVGLQSGDDCDNFIESVEWFLDARVDRADGIVTYAGHRTTIRAYPVSIEWPSDQNRQLPPPNECRESVGERLGIGPGVRLAIGIDRLDYTKGIIEKCLAVEKLLEAQPELRGRFTLVQVAEPSRSALPAYGDLRERLLATVARIDARFGAAGYRPIVLLESHHEPLEVFRLYRAADLCYVASLHDGMNLVAKEFVSARDDERGVLVLSRFTGAARELDGALIVNPYDIDEAADALSRALRMTGREQASRMQTLRGIVADFNAYRWAGEMLADATRLRAATLHVRGRRQLLAQSDGAAAVM